MPWWAICTSLVVAWLGWKLAGFAAWWWRIASGLRGLPAVKYQNSLLGAVVEVSRKDTSRMIQEWSRTYGPGLYYYRILCFYVRTSFLDVLSCSCNKRT
jgi:hypothetical protein